MKLIKNHGSEAFTDERYAFLIHVRSNGYFSWHELMVEIPSAIICSSKPFLSNGKYFKFIIGQTVCLFAFSDMDLAGWEAGWLGWPIKAVLLPLPSLFPSCSLRTSLTAQGPQTSSGREIRSPISLRPPLLTLFSNFLFGSFTSKQFAFTSGYRSIRRHRINTPRAAHFHPEARAGEF